MIKKKKTINDAVNPQAPETEDEDFDVDAVLEAPISSKEKKKTTHLMKGFSLLLAVVLWCFVILNENPTRRIWIRNVPVQILNKNTLESRDLVILREEPLFIDIRLEGKQNTLSTITVDDIKAQINLEDVTNAGFITLPATIDIPGTSGIIVKDQKKKNGALEIDVIREAKLQIKPKITGEQAMLEGYALTNATVSPETVTVKAPSSILSTLSAVTESVDISNKTESGSTEVSISILDATGSAITPIKCTPKKTTLSYTLAVTDSVKIEPIIENANALSSRYEIFASAVIPDSITVRGDDVSMRQLNKLPTEPIDVLKLYEGFEEGYSSDEEWTDVSLVTTVAAKLIFPEGISAVGEENISEVQVSITYRSLSSNEPPITVDNQGFRTEEEIEP